MNKYNVIHLDISSVWDFHKEDLIESIHERVCDELLMATIDGDAERVAEIIELAHDTYTSVYISLKI